MVSDLTDAAIPPLSGLVALLLAAVPCAAASELVRFESARYQQGPLQERLARERGEAPQAAEVIQGHLTKPPGDGPYPAVAILHGCTGLPDNVKAGAKGFWPEHLERSGYVVLTVDSFTSRNVDNACTSGGPSRAADAYGALAFLSRQPFVDPKRIALLGFASGGAAALSVVEKQDSELFEGERD
jgi:dienelactone hydrolase